MVWSYRIVTQRMSTPGGGELVLRLADGSDPASNGCARWRSKVLLPNLVLTVAARLCRPLGGTPRVAPADRWTGGGGRRSPGT